MSSSDALMSEATAILNGFKVAAVNKEKKEKLSAILVQLRKDNDDVQIQNEKLKCEADKVFYSASTMCIVSCHFVLLISPRLPN